MAEENVTHELAAIVYADVSGYSRLTEADEIGTHRQLSASLELIADRIRNAAGEVVHYAGDAVLARFQSVVAATNCAIGIQNAISTLCAELAEDKRLLFRIGINLGEVIVDRNDIVTIEPTFSISTYVETQPYRNSRTLEGVAGTLREAGLPD